MRYVLPAVVIAVVLTGTGLAPWLLVFAGLGKMLFYLLLAWLSAVAVVTVLAVVFLAGLLLVELAVRVLRAVGR